MIMKDIKTMLQEWHNGKYKIGIYTTTDESNNNVIVEIANDYLKTTTMQNNGWARVQYYYLDGTVEETYER